MKDLLCTVGWGALVLAAWLAYWALVYINLPFH